MQEISSVPRGPSLAERVADAFAVPGSLAGVVPGFEPRTSQREMAGAVADIFEEGGVLLAEAGTGIGKTLAYLVPAILSQQRVLVSTGTKNLQEQIFLRIFRSYAKRYLLHLRPRTLKAVAITSVSTVSSR